MPSGDITIKFLLVMVLTLFFDAAIVSPVEAAAVSIDAIIVTPVSPSPSTLCTLKVRLKNSGNLAVSFLKFSVKIDGQDVPTYKPQTYVINIAPGTVGELELYNFYSPVTAKSFEVQATLVEAQWVQVKKVESTTTTTPSGPVEGLPISGSLSVKMPGGK